MSVINNKETVIKLVFTENRSAKMMTVGTVLTTDHSHFEERYSKLCTHSSFNI